MRVRNRYRVNDVTMSALVVNGIDIKTYVAGKFILDIQATGLAELSDELTLENFDVVRDVDDGSWVIDLVGRDNSECQLVHDALTSYDISAIANVELVE
jgi:hypothetical protein